MCKLCYEWHEKRALGRTLSVARNFTECSCPCTNDSLTNLKDKNNDVYTLCRKCGHGFYGGGTERKHIDPAKPKV